MSLLSCSYDLNNHYPTDASPNFIKQSAPSSVTPSSTEEKNEYFSSDEAQFNGIVVNVTTVEQMLELLGEPIEIEERMGDSISTAYIYTGVVYESLNYSENKITSIVITECLDLNSPRDIKIGDSIYSVLDKFPYEKDPAENEGLFFGESTVEGAGGMLSEETAGSDAVKIKKVTITSELVDPFLIIKFKDDVVYEIVITMRTT